MTSIMMELWWPTLWWSFDDLHYDGALMTKHYGGALMTYIMMELWWPTWWWGAQTTYFMMGLWWSTLWWSSDDLHYDAALMTSLWWSSDDQHHLFSICSFSGPSVHPFTSSVLLDVISLVDCSIRDLLLGQRSSLNQLRSNQSVSCFWTQNKCTY